MFLLYHDMLRKCVCIYMIHTHISKSPEAKINQVRQDWYDKNNIIQAILAFQEPQRNKGSNVDSQDPKFQVLRKNHNHSAHHIKSCSRFLSHRVTAVTSIFDGDFHKKKHPAFGVPLRAGTPPVRAPRPKVGPSSQAESHSGSALCGASGAGSASGAAGGDGALDLG